MNTSTIKQHAYVNMQYSHNIIIVSVITCIFYRKINCMFEAETYHLTTGLSNDIIMQIFNFTEQLSAIRRMSLAKIMCNNLNIERIQHRVMFLPSE